jgi:hypothetical protein
MSYRICTSCGASDGQGCYSTCPTMLQARVTELEAEVRWIKWLLRYIDCSTIRGEAEAVGLRRVQELEKEVQWHKDNSARRGEADAVLLRRVTELKQALQWIDQQRYTDRNTITPDNAFEQWARLNADLVAIMDKARAALCPTIQQEK